MINVWKFEISILYNSFRATIDTLNDETRTVDDLMLNRKSFQRPEPCSKSVFFQEWDCLEAIAEISISMRPYH